MTHPGLQHDCNHLKPFNTGKLKLAAVSLGCEKNRIDTEEVLGYLVSRGFILTDDIREADIVIVNTCSFIDRAKQESINTLLEIAAQPGPKKPLTVAAGCLVETYGSDIINKIPEIDGAVGVHSYRYLEKFMRLLLRGRRVVIKNKPGAIYSSLSPRVLTTPVHSAFVKIAEGCSNRCHFCLIPSIRGPYRSREPAEILEEIKNLLAGGAREINLIAQDTTAYGTDRKNFPGLSDLIENILGIKQDFWLRILYTYPSRIDDRLLELIASDTRICNYLDLPIQHVVDKVLAAMGRRYGRQDLTTLLERLRKINPDLTLRTTCMVGFPGETRRGFEKLLNFFSRYPFERLGAFVYSPQAGTAACGYNRQVPRRVGNKRLRELMTAQQTTARLLNEKQLGRDLIIMVDRVIDADRGLYYGRSQYQAPEVDGGVYIYAKETLAPGAWVSARINAVSAYDLVSSALSTSALSTY